MAWWVVSFGGFAVGAVALVLLIAPTRSRLRAFKQVPPVELEPGWIALEFRDLGAWLKGVATGGGTIVLAAVAGVLFSSVKKSQDVTDALGTIVSVLGYAVIACCTVWTSRFALRLRTVVLQHPDLEMKRRPWFDSLVMGGLVGFCFSLSTFVLLRELL